MSNNLSFAAKALGLFMDGEAAKGAEEGLAYELAESLKQEAEEGGATALQNLPPLKQAILNYAMESAEELGYEPF